MGLLCAVVMMVAIFAITWTVSRWDAKTAYRLFEHTQHLFEPEVDSPVATPVKASIGNRDNRESSKRSSAEGMPRGGAGRRPYISPIIKKEWPRSRNGAAPSANSSWMRLSSLIIAHLCFAVDIQPMKVIYKLCVKGVTC